MPARMISARTALLYRTSPNSAPSTSPDWNASGAHAGIASSHARFHDDGRPSAK